LLEGKISSLKLNKDEKDRTEGLCGAGAFRSVREVRPRRKDGEQQGDKTEALSRNPFTFDKPLPILEFPGFFSLQIHGQVKLEPIRVEEYGAERGNVCAIVLVKSGPTILTIFSCG